MRSKVVRHHRFYIPPDGQAGGGIVRFSKGESRHMLASLRVRKGDLIAATDGNGLLYRIRVQDTSAREVVGRIEDSERVERLGPPVYLFQAVIKPTRMELVVEKATELGLWEFTPVRAFRSKGSVGPVRLERLRKAAIEAMKQSLGAYLPRVHEMVTMDEGLEMSSDLGLILLAREGEGVPTLRCALDAYEGGRIALWIGPEGGFSRSEMESLEERRAIPFTLGRERLKSETAAIASLAVLRQST